MHLAVYRHFPEVQAVIHAHPFHVLPFVVAEKPIPAVLEATQKFESIELVPYAPAHSQDLADNVVTGLRVREASIRKQAGAVLLPRHGIVVAGKDVLNTVDALERLDALLHAAGAGMPVPEMRRRLARAFEVVVYLERQRDGMRRATHLADVTVADDVMTSRDLFTFDPDAGRFIATGVQPGFLPRVGRAGLERALRDAL